MPLCSWRLPATGPGRPPPRLVSVTTKQLFVETKAENPRASVCLFHAVAVNVVLAFSLFLAGRYSRCDLTTVCLSIFVNGCLDCFQRGAGMNETSFIVSVILPVDLLFHLSWGLSSRSIIGAYVNVIKNCQTLLQRSWSILRAHQQYTSVRLLCTRAHTCYCPAFFF